MLLRFLLGVLAAAYLTDAMAVNVYDLYALALIRDPEFQVAVKEKDAALQNPGINRSYLLPNLSYGYNQAYNMQSLTVLPASQGVPTTPYNYSSIVSQFNISQTVVNFAQLANYKKGIAQAAFGSEQYKTKALSLAIRLLGAYFDVLYSSDQIRLLKSQIKSLSSQEIFNRKALEFGQGTKTDLVETQARLEVAQSQLIDAEDSLQNNLRLLQSYTGLTADELKSKIDPLKNNFSFLKAPNQALEEDEKVALSINPDILAAKFNMEAARQDVNVKQAGQYPTATLQGSYGKTVSQYITQYNQQYNGGSIGFQVNVPIFAGGYNVYSTRQSMAALEMAEADLNLKTEKIKIELQKQFNLLKSLRSQIAALGKAVESSKFLIEATKKSIAGGVRTNIDLLNAEQQYVQVSRDLAKAKYDYMLAYARYKVAVGVFSDSDLAEISTNLSQLP